MNRMSIIHIWIGTTNKKLEDFESYFDLTTFYESEEDEDFERCGFCNQIKNADSYDSDFIGIYYNESSNDLNLAIQETPDSRIYNLIKEECEKKNIKEANAMFYYRDSELPKVDTERKYNDLMYLSNFNLNQ